MKGLSGLMDRRVKERLVGATILVGLLVLIVPELLSGPKRPAPANSTTLPASESTEPMRTVTVDLATRKATAAEPDVAPASAAGEGSDSGESASAAGSPLADTPSAASSGAPAPTITTLKAQQPSNAPAPVENEAPPPKSTVSPKVAVVHEATRSGWAVQLGSFASRANAENLVRQLKGHDAPAYVSSSGKGPQLRYKVRIGPLADRAAAERMRSKLTRDGHPGSLVAP